MTREEWLLNVINEMERLIFVPNEVIVPKIEVSTNKPGGKSKAWTIDALNSADNETYHIFISSEVSEKSTLIELLFGELIYCIAGRRPTRQFKHQFSLTRAGKRWYPEIGSSTHEALKSIERNISDDYPHVPVIVEEKDKKQSTRMLKIQCAAHERPIILRGSRESFTTGFPICSCGGAFIPVGWSLEEEDEYERPTSEEFTTDS